jgi:hypothetical protein
VSRSNLIAIAGSAAVIDAGIREEDFRAATMPVPSSTRCSGLPLSTIAVWVCPSLSMRCSGKKASGTPLVRGRRLVCPESPNGAGEWIHERCHGRSLSLLCHVHMSFWSGKVRIEARVVVPCFGAILFARRVRPAVGLRWTADVILD